MFSWKVINYALHCICQELQIFRNFDDIQNQHKESIPEQFVIAKSRLFQIQTHLRCPALQIIIYIQDELGITFV